jgi:hypothetical protein
MRRNVFGKAFHSPGGRKHRKANTPGGGKFSGSVGTQVEELTPGHNHKAFHHEPAASATAGELKAFARLDGQANRNVRNAGKKAEAKRMSRAQTNTEHQDMNKKRREVHQVRSNLKIYLEAPLFVRMTCCFYLL